MAENDRRHTACPGIFAGAQDVTHGILAHVRQIDDHAQTVHLPDQCFPGWTYAIPVRRRFRDAVSAWNFRESGIGEDIVAVVREGCVADT